MNPKRLSIGALPLLIFGVALWWVGKYQPTTVEIEGVGYPVALRALAKACRDYPLSRQITLRRVQADNATEADELVYSRRKHQLSWKRPLRYDYRFWNVGEDVIQALAESRDGSPRQRYDSDAYDFLLKRGCRDTE